MGSEGYPEMSYLCHSITPCYKPKELQHKFHCGENLRSQKKSYCEHSSYCHCCLFQLCVFSAI